MAFIKVQKLTRAEDGAVSGGTASIIDTSYVSGAKYHSKQHVRERLGKVISLSEDKKQGIFLSPTRGLVEYNSVTDTFTALDKNDARVHGSDVFPPMLTHTVFGDTYMLLMFLKKAGLMDIFRAVFPKDTDYERLLCHVLHGLLKDGARISCDNFIAKSFASYVLPDVPLSTLRSDTVYYSHMGDDRTRMNFFQSFIAAMRKNDPEFGRGCYVDSTPLPNDIEDNPFNALSCHGVSSSSVQMRLVLVLDEITGIPVWYDIIPGNVLDINTIMTVINDVAVSLDITVESLVLDAGYVSKELIEAFHIGTSRTIIGRMPNRRGYPYKTLYWGTKALMGKGKYHFVRKNHTYFGKKKEVEVFGHREYAYVFVDQYNALRYYRDYLKENAEDYALLKDRDKDWLTVKGGYFILLSNMDKTPAEILTDYFDRAEIEMVFKTSKEYLNLLPISKWTNLTVRGKILHDIIDTITLLIMRKIINPSGISTSELTGKLQSLMCFRDRDGKITIETASKQVKEYYALLGIPVPAHLNTKEFMASILGLKM